MTAGKAAVLPATPASATDAAHAPRLAAIVERGMAHLRAKRHEQARAAFDDALTLDPGHLVALYQRANTGLAANALDAARRDCDAALARHPGHPDLEMLSGAIAAAAHDPHAALDAFERARAGRPDLPGIDERIGEQLAFLGRGSEAIAAYDREIARQPDNFPLGSSRLFLLNHFGLLDRARAFEEHRRWGERLEHAVADRRRPHRNDRSPDRRLRVGYVSPDLRHHAIAFWIEGYLSAHDATRCEAHAFDVSPYAEDAVSRRLRGRFDHWYRCGAMSDDELADLVRGQRIDVLVDLAGHTAHHRLGTFARKPAPVQASWFGYMNTSGLTTIDWRLTDAQHDPPGSEAYYTEKLWRLPFLACFTPDPASPEPGPPPFERHAYATFASVNNWAKVSEDAKDAWAAILRDAPGTRLKVIARGGEEPRTRDDVRAAFARRGVDAARIDVSPFLPLADFLAFFRDVDVALDPFPYGGGTTTLHTLWMGVPVVALEGDSELARATPASLRGIGESGFVATTVDGYVALATALGRDPAPLAAARARLRDAVRTSVAMDYPGLARNVEAAFRGMWRAWCEAPPT
ncbi:MAG TPA: tetratricopeptide repeat protein [Casimicrobiaceae bacterium]|nr:tetratricopeptide repeat protein [Casimicrobiaceae bacterium]